MTKEEEKELKRLKETINIPSPSDYWAAKRESFKLSLSAARRESHSRLNILASKAQATYGLERHYYEQRAREEVCRLHKEVAKIKRIVANFCC